MVIDLSNEDYNSKEFFFEDETMFQYNTGMLYLNDDVTHYLFEKMKKYGDYNCVLEKSEFDIEFSQEKDIIKTPYQKYNIELIE